MICIASQTRIAAVVVTTAAAIASQAAAGVAVYDHAEIAGLAGSIGVDFESTPGDGDISIAVRGGSMTLPHDAYSPLGFTFSPAVKVVHDGYNPFRFAQFLEGAVPTFTQQDGFNAIPSSEVDMFSIAFSVPVRSFGLMVATARVYSGDTDIQEPTFRVYDENDQMIETLSFSEGSAFVNGTLSDAGDVVDHGFMGFSSSALIGRIEIEKEQAIFDEFVFAPVQIPAPAGAALMSLAGLGLARRRR